MANENSSLDTFWQLYKAQYATDPELAEFFTDEALAPFMNLDHSFIDNFMELTKYQGDQGLDIRRLQKRIIKNYRKTANYCPSMTTTITEDEQGKPLRTVSLGKNISSDIMMCLALFNTKSQWNNVENKGVSTTINWLKSRFVIDLTRSTKTHFKLGPEVVTVRRMEACFPHYMCQAYDNDLCRSLVSFSDIGVPIEKQAALKRCILCTSFPSVVSKDACRVAPEIHIVFFLVRVLIDKLVSGAEKTKIEQIYNFYRASFDSHALTNDQRDAWCRANCIVTKDGSFESVYVELITDAKIILQKIKGGESMYDSVLEKLQRPVLY